MPDASTTGASTNGDSARRREHNQGNQARKYTPEQEATVQRIRRCNPTAFYEILDIPKTASDAEVKKAYRKLSLLTHPDKNGHPHADEAFKMVARAFSVLGDKEKREKFDKWGTDPDSRFAQAQAQAQAAGAGMGGTGGNPFMGRRGQPMWDEEISPEELFARMFGGPFGGFGGPFGAFDGQQFVFNFGGGPGIRVHHFGGPRPRTRPRNAQNNRDNNNEIPWWTQLAGWLPILILVFWPLISTLISGLTSTFTPATPSMAFDAPNPPLYTLERTMPNLGFKYYLNPADVHSYSAHKLASLDKKAEVVLVQQLRLQCENEMAHKERLREAARGWFYQDQKKMELANNYDMPACRRLHSLRV